MFSARLGDIVSRTFVRDTAGGSARGEVSVKLDKFLMA